MHYEVENTKKTRIMLLSKVHSQETKNVALIDNLYKSWKFFVGFNVLLLIEWFIQVRTPNWVVFVNFAFYFIRNEFC